MAKRAESRTRYFIRNLAKTKGWNIEHVLKNGDFLEEQEIVDVFPDIGLGLDKPDFLICLKGNPTVVVEAKNDSKKINSAIEEAIEYSEQINATGKYSIKIAVGVAGEIDNGYHIQVKFQQKSD